MAQVKNPITGQLFTPSGDVSAYTKLGWTVEPDKTPTPPAGGTAPVGGATPITTDLKPAVPATKLPEPAPEQKTYDELLKTSTADLTSKAQSEISAIEDAYKGLITKSSDQEASRESGITALVGSGQIAGTAAAAKSSKGSQDTAAKEQSGYTADMTKAIAGIYDTITSNAITIANNELTDQKQRTDLADKVKTDAIKSFDDLSKVTKVTWNDFKTSNADFADKLVSQSGYDDATAAFKWNAAKDANSQIQWQTPQKTDTGYLFYGLNPLTGKIETQEVKTATVSADWQVSPANLYQDTLMYNKKTGEYKTMAQYNDSISNNVVKSLPDGSNGGQCGDYVHTIVDGMPEMGDTIASKDALIDSKGVKAADWKPKIGDVIIQNIGVNGHAAVVNKVNSDGTVTLSESNYHLDEKVTNNRTISAKDPAIYGAYTNTQIKGGVADGTKSKRELALDLKYQKDIASLNRTKQMTESGEVMAISRRNTVVRSVLTQLYGSTTTSPIAVFNKSAQVINRVEPSLKRALDPNNKAKNVADLDLVDAYVQIARGGGQITEAQVDTLLSGLGVSAKWDVATQKVTGSASLDDNSRKELANLSKKIYAEQKKSAESGVKQVNEQLSSQGIPDNYLLKKPEDLTGALAAPKITQQVADGYKSQLQAGEIMAVDSDGNPVAATQDEIDSGEYTVPEITQ